MASSRCTTSVCTRWKATTHARPAKAWFISRSCLFLIVSRLQASRGPAPRLTGDWIFTWPEEAGAEKTTLAHLQQEKNAYANGDVPITGIIEPVSGDTGLLHGTVYSDGEGQTLFHLSRFDGIHVLAIDGQLLPDGS